jgi:hypothetical protein
MVTATRLGKKLKLPPIVQLKHQLLLRWLTDQMLRAEAEAKTAAWTLLLQKYFGRLNKMRNVESIFRSAGFDYRALLLSDSPAAAFATQCTTIKLMQCNGARLCKEN